MTNDFTNILLRTEKPFSNIFWKINKYLWIIIFSVLIFTCFSIVFVIILKHFTLSKLIATILAWYAFGVYCFFMIFLLILGNWGLSFWSKLKFKKIEKVSNKTKNLSIFYLTNSKFIDQLVSEEKYNIYGNIKKIDNFYELELDRLKSWIICITIILLNIGLGVLQWYASKSTNFFLVLIYLNSISTFLLLIAGVFIAKSIPDIKKQQEKYYENNYSFISEKILKFKIFLNSSNLDKIKKQDLKNLTFLPLYFNFISDNKKLRQELIVWKKYLDTSFFYNKIIHIKITFSVLENDILNLKNKKWKILTEKFKEISDILKEEKFNKYIFSLKYYYLIKYIKKSKIKSNINFQYILQSLKNRNIYFYKEIGIKNKKTIDERDLDYNFFQLNYFEYLYSITNKI